MLNWIVGAISSIALLAIFLTAFWVNNEKIPVWIKMSVVVVNLILILMFLHKEFMIVINGGV